MAQRVNQLWNGRSNTHYHKPKQGRLSSLFPKSSQIWRPFWEEKGLVLLPQLRYNREQKRLEPGMGGEP